MRRRFGREALAIVALAAIACLGGSASGTAATGGGLRLAKVATLDHPLYTASAPGDSKRLYVVEEPGKIMIIRNGKVLRRPFVDLRGRVLYDESEQGMYSIAFDPGYAQNGRFYVYYVNRDGNIEVDVLRRSKRDATRADLGSRRTVIEVSHPNSVFENGGQLQFGPDGFLYIGTGDGENAGVTTQGGNSQDTDSLLGKLLRIDPNPGGGYKVPSSNPFGGSSGKPEIYATGVRNPYRFSFDPRDGDLYLADVGDSHWEEVDRVDSSDLAGANFGWKLFEGSHAYDGDGTKPPNYEPPVFEYSHDNSANCAVLGGLVVHDHSLGGLDGKYLYSDVCAGDLHAFDPGDPAGTDAAIGLHVELPTSITAPNGHVYVTSLAGGVYRVKEGR
jgi:glucose/arabinose dehydrogenase